MKKILYTLCIVVLSATLQSCDKINELFKDRDTAQEEFSDTDNEDAVSSIDTSNIKSQLLQKDSVIRSLKEEISATNKELGVLQDTIRNLAMAQDKIKNDSIGLKNLFLYLLVFTIVVVVLVVIMINKLVKGKLSDSRLRDFIVDTYKRQQQTSASGNKEDLLLKTNKWESSLRDISELRNKVCNLENKLRIMEMSYGQQSHKTQPAPIVLKRQEAVKQPEHNDNVFYMKKPLEEMKFDSSLKSSTATEETFYRFEVDKNNRRFALFYFECGAPSSVRMAFNNKSSYLDKVCTSSGDNINGSYICTTPGEAKLEGDKWVVTRKANVVFD